ncbi:MAG: SGNH/GDSL hydrolase family protein [Acidobacteriota bacterium]
MSTSSPSGKQQFAAGKSQAQRARRPRRRNSRLSGWRGLLARLLVMAVAGLFALLFGELALRLAAPQQLVVVRPDIWVPDDTGLGWRMAAGLDTEVNTGEGEVRLVTDGQGFRIDPQAPPPASDLLNPDPTRVLVLGDSFAAALQVEAADAFPELIRHQLTQRLERPVEVVNASCGGWGPSHYRLLLQQQVGAAREAGRPFDLALVAFFLGNDIEKVAVDRFPPRASSRAQRGLHWPTEFSFRGIKGALLYPLNDALEQRSHLYQLFKKGSWQLLMRVGLSARRVAATDLARNLEDPRWELTAEVLAEMQRFAAGEELPLLVALIPSAVHTDPDLATAYAGSVGLEIGPEGLQPGQARERVSRLLTERGVPFVDATEALRRQQSSGDLTHGRVDTHLSPAGHRGLRDVVMPTIEGLIQQRTEGADVSDAGSSGTDSSSTGSLSSAPAEAS